MNVEQLKNSILQLAIQGKLVEQREEEGTAEELYQQIQYEKNQLIKEGKLKKSKPLPPINPDEVQFDIPTSWRFVNLDNVTLVSSGYAFKSQNFKLKGIRVIRISDFNEVGFVDKNIVRHEFIQDLGQFEINSGDIIVCMTGGTVGKSLFVNNLKEKMYLNQRIARIACGKFLLSSYIDIFIKSPYVQLEVKTSVNSTNDNISMLKIKSLPVPLPPLKEQQRIVDKIEELMPLIEEYGESYVKLEELNKSFPQDIKLSILQYAIQGKLVEQREEEGTGEELYQQIQLEKNQFIKEGKVKKSKPLPPIDLDEVPFEIPATWKWNYIREITYDLGQKTPTAPFFYIDVNSIDNNIFEVRTKKMFASNDSIPSRARKIVKANSVIFSSVRPYLKNVAVIKVDPEEEFIVSTAFIVMHQENNILSKFLFFFLQTNFLIELLNEKMRGATYPAITANDLLDVGIPLPPLPEQQRIVDKIEELLSITKALEGEIQ